MRNVRFVMAFMVTVMALTAVQQVYALCSSGRRELSVQHSDIRLEPGVLNYLPIRIMTVSLPIPAGAFPPDCGLSAKSELPGMHIISGYGIVPPATNPPGVWTWIGSTATANPAAQPWFGWNGGEVEYFSILFMGTDPGAAQPGTHGRIVIGVNVGGDIPVMRPIGVINVHVGYPSTPTPTWFTASSNAGNVSGNRMALDHPLLNGKPDAKLFVAHLINPPGLTPRYWNHPLVTVYNSTLLRWVIANADGAQMPVGLGFNVQIDQSALQAYTGAPGAFPPVPYVQINDPTANDNPYATIAVSMTSGLAANPHPVAVEYSGSRWRIVNSDNALIPRGVRFNVRVVGFSAYHRDGLGGRQDKFVANSAGISVTDITPGGSPPSSGRILHFWWAGGNRTVPMLVTPNRTPMGTAAPTTGRYVGLKYVEGIRPRWSVFHEDESVIPFNAAFNVFAQPQPLLH